MVNVKLAGFVGLLGVGFYFLGTDALVPSFVLFIAFVLSPFSNQENVRFLMFFFKNVEEYLLNTLDSIRQVMQLEVLNQTKLLLTENIKIS